MSSLRLWVEDNHRASGVIDSGVGGLTVVRGISRSLPHGGAVWISDTARVLYSPRSCEEVRGVVFQTPEFLSHQELTMAATP